MALRAELAGHQLARAIVEMVNLMYQNKTAAKFYAGLIPVLNTEIERRSLDTKANQIIVRSKRSAQQLQDKSEPADITPSCITCLIRRSICPHQEGDKGCRSIYELA